MNSYKRLPGRGASLAHYYSLYLGTDCLLQVAATGWSERYKRFYYEDIRAVIVRRTNSAALYNAVLAGLALSFAALALFDVAPFAMILFSLAFALPLAYSLMAGPSCVCHIYTSVQVERLPSVRRLRTAHTILGRLRPLIEQAQGQIPEPQAPTTPTPDSPATS